MESMKRNSLSIGVFALILVATLANLAFVENCGWAQTRWGMNVNEVIKATGLRVVPASGDKPALQYVAPKVDIFTYSFEGTFTFAEGKALDSITLYSRQGKGSTNDAAFIYLIDRLAEKYGQPVLFQDNKDLVSRTYKWATTCLVIDLIFISSDKTDGDTLILKYRPNSSIADPRF
ncbi:MAG: hypothetical protein A2051_05780 [Desulfovibrionales bacterium GWA2_65_9]|nr:MAG: hypothetical protein A2051_05780 [Desulfovibrionales bacterium GWA2_65_9]